MELTAGSDTELLSTKAGAALIDWRTSRLIAAIKPAAHLRTRRYTVPAQHSRAANDFLRTRLARSSAFDGELLGLGSDLRAVLARSEPVELVPGGYFDHLRTDIAFGTQSLAPEVEWRFQAIGVSVLALTEDNLLVVLRQSATNQSSRQLLAPTGSGSLEPQDAAGGATGLLPILETGALRELGEESGILAEVIGDTYFLGFARWLEKGAKPEFFFLSHLACTGAELQFAQRTALEQAYASELCLLPLARDEATGEVDLPVPAHEISLPLAVGLRLLGGAL